MTTTGAITRKNYTDSSYGHKGDFHHTFGACLVELHDDTVFHVRQINALRDGSFMDLDCRYTKDGVEEGIPIEALIMGDTHVDFVDPDVVRATFGGPKSIVGFLKPKFLVWHDLLDFYSRSKHTRNDPFITVAKYKANMLNVLDEIKRACEFVSEMTPKGVRNVLVPSNHPEFLLQWLRETDWRTDPENAEMYLETALEVVRSATVGDNGAEFIDPFLMWAKRLMTCADRTAFLERDTSFKIKNIELAMHGDMGPNGSRGSARNLARIGSKSVIGHSHSPNIREGCYQVGTSSRLRLEYNRGPSSWLNTHCVIYANGKRCLVHIIDGVWRAQ